MLKLAEHPWFLNRFKPMISSNNDRFHHQVAGKYLEYAKLVSCLMLGMARDFNNDGSWNSRLEQTWKVQKTGWPSNHWFDVWNKNECVSKSGRPQHHKLFTISLLTRELMIPHGMLQGKTLLTKPNNATPPPSQGPLQSSRS